MSGAGAEGGGARPQPRGTVACTGAWGMLGKEVIRAAAARGIDLLSWDLDDFDLTDREGTLRAVGAARPRVVIHGAAWTDVDGCETDRAKAVHVTGRGTANLAAACREAGARLLMVSTDYVFSGRCEKPYRETDAPGPISAYGWSKLIGEEAVLALGEDGAIARTAWLYADHGTNFLLTMRRLAEALDVKAGALYWHFPNKQSLLAGVADRILGDLRTEEPEDPDEALPTWAFELRDVLLSQRDAAARVQPVEILSHD